MFTTYNCDVTTVFFCHFFFPFKIIDNVLAEKERKKGRKKEKRKKGNRKERSHASRLTRFIHGHNMFYSFAFFFFALSLPHLRSFDSLSHSLSLSHPSTSSFLSGNARRGFSFSFFFLASRGIHVSNRMY